MKYAENIGTFLGARNNQNLNRLQRFKHTGHQIPKNTNPNCKK